MQGSRDTLACAVIHQATCVIANCFNIVAKVHQRNYLRHPANRSPFCGAASALLSPQCRGAKRNSPNSRPRSSNNRQLQSQRVGKSAREAAVVTTTRFPANRGDLYPAGRFPVAPEEIRRVAGPTDASSANEFSVWNSPRCVQPLTGWNKANALFLAGVADWETPRRG